MSIILPALTVTSVSVRAQDNVNNNGYGAVDNSPRNRGYGFLMLEEPVSPRNAAMGSAGTALGGYGFRYYNPAQPFFSPARSSCASAEFGRMPGDVNRGGFETAALFPDWFGAISFFSSAVDYRTSDERGPGATASSVTTVGALSVGYIRDNVAAGIGVGMVEDRIWVSSNYTAIALSVGIGYKILDDKLSLGAAWMNAAAWSRGFAGDESHWYDGRVPMFARAGAAWSDTRWSLPYTVAADAAYRDEDGTFSVPIGLEVKVLPCISLRIGKRIGWENEVVSLGIGFNIDRLSFDAAFTPTVFVDDYEMKWSMGFSYNIGTRKKAPAKEEPVPPLKESVPIEEEAVPTEDEPEAIEEETEATEEVTSTEESALTEESVPTDESTATDETAPEEGAAPADKPVPED
ncbi:MAG: hypothetical protein LBB74_09995 [Chitinispirillales bacterium]|nr:hypothetical protein [Chitinispirillales bacterium]